MQFRCRTCNIEGEDYFYKSKKYFCKSCWNKRTTKTGKDKIVLLKLERGAACERCGYDKCQEALQWHHLDPSVKEFSIAVRKGLNYQTLKEEISKCQLLCANCHAEVHSNPSGIATINNRRRQW